MTKPIQVSDAEFEEKVLQAELPVIVDFWAPWCAPCKMIAPVLEDVAKEYDGKLVVAKVNTDENPEFAIQYGVMGIPTLLFTKDGEIFDRHVGAAPPAVIKEKALGLIKSFQAAHE
ncbi:MAG: thioredoxin [Anaerolineales bacterium]|nr:thioredoxin [Anaerolineales bacterium]